MPLNATDLADAIETGFQSAWALLKPPAIGDIGAPDRRVLFLGIAQGVLDYLEAQQDQMFSSISLRRAGTTRTYTVTALDLNKA